MSSYVSANAKHGLEQSQKDEFLVGPFQGRQGPLSWDLAKPPSLLALQAGRCGWPVCWAEGILEGSAEVGVLEGGGLVLLLLA